MGPDKPKGASKVRERGWEGKGEGEGVAIGACARCGEEGIPPLLLPLLLFPATRFPTLDEVEFEVEFEVSEENLSLSL